MAKKETAKNSNNNQERRWSVPSKRAASFADERKAKIHKHGDKEGKELTEYEAGLRSGYLMCQSDHAGVYIYKKALDEGKSKSEAKRLYQLTHPEIEPWGKKKPEEAA